VRAGREYTGRPALTFDWFYAAYPDFPVRLRTRCIPYLYATTAIDRWRCPEVLVTAYEEARGEEADAEDSARAFPCEVVFRWRGFGSSGLVCLHNSPFVPDGVQDYSWSCDREQGTTRRMCVYAAPRGKGSFLTAVGRFWSPPDR
jgi:hypothetical protein